MSQLRNNDVAEQLSHVHLHAICAHARMCKSEVTRLEDNAGIDAKVRAWLPPPSPDETGEVDIKVQLKATKIKPKETATHYLYPLKKENYDQLRPSRIVTLRILVVLFLPPDFDDWLHHSHDQLLLRRCAYWVSLKGAPASNNSTSQTIYLPKNQPLTPQTLQNLAQLCLTRDFPTY